MIEYDPGKWHVCFIFAWRGSVFPKAFCWAMPSGLFAVIIFHCWHLLGFDVDENVGQIWSSYMFVLGFLIVFRSQQAYGRFWEGATLLNQVRGEWFNAVSSLFAFCSDKSEKQQDVKAFQELIVRLMSLLYCSALQHVANMEDEAFDILDVTGIEHERLQFLISRDDDDRCKILLQWIQKLVCMNIGTGVIPIPPPILSRVFQELSRGIVGVNNATKISDTCSVARTDHAEPAKTIFPAVESTSSKDIPFPFPYAQMVTVMLLITAFVTPWVAGTLMDNSVRAGGLTFVSVFAFFSINYIAAEIELPFGDDANDLPIADYMRKMNRDLLLLMMEDTQNPPKFISRSKSSEPCFIMKMRDETIEAMVNELVESHGPGDEPLANSDDGCSKTVAQADVHSSAGPSPENNKASSMGMSQPKDFQGKEPVGDSVEARSKNVAQSAAQHLSVQDIGLREGVGDQSKGAAQAEPELSRQPNIVAEAPILVSPPLGSAPELTGVSRDSHSGSRTADKQSKVAPSRPSQAVRSSKPGIRHVKSFEGDCFPAPTWEDPGQGSAPNSGPASSQQSRSEASNVSNSTKESHAIGHETPHPDRTKTAPLRGVTSVPAPAIMH